jgi:hypothetical protein
MQNHSCGWPKLQITCSGIKSNSEVLEIGKNNNLVFTVKTLDGFH